MLRDGALAIAGVVNVILKNAPEGGCLSVKVDSALRNGSSRKSPVSAVRAAGFIYAGRCRRTAGARNTPTTVPPKRHYGKIMSPGSRVQVAEQLDRDSGIVRAVIVGATCADTYCARSAVKNDIDLALGNVVAGVRHHVSAGLAIEPVDRAVRVEQRAGG